MWGLLRDGYLTRRSELIGGLAGVATLEIVSELLS